MTFKSMFFTNNSSRIDNIGHRLRQTFCKRGSRLKTPGTKRIASQSSKVSVLSLSELHKIKTSSNMALDLPQPPVP